MRLATHVASRTDAGRRSSPLFLFAAAMLVPLLGSCAGCGDDPLHDISCHPGDPASGQFDADLPELCDNRIDDNCDGRINEGCACVDGETLVCGTDEGECESATVVCSGGRFPGCVPKKGPEPEICDGKDNDCRDGIDNGIAPVDCFDGPADAIIDGTTPCRTGHSFCQDGAMTACLGQVLPQAERCNGIDDDCDGETDEDPVSDGAVCGPSTGVGACMHGREVCAGGESFCVGAVYGQNEACNGIDDDCDGETDEDLYRPCQTACGQGIERCLWGGWAECSAPVPQMEVCDGADNDCDGVVDEGCPCVSGDAQTCTENMVDSQGDPATCGIGVQICDLSGQWGQCRFFGTEDERCDDWDNDCDGTVDGIGRSCGDATTAGIGACTLGTEVCEAGTWGPCVGAVAPAQEVCNGVDDDCDGTADEDLNPHDRVDMVFAVDISGSMCVYISALAQGIGNYVQGFSETDHRFALVVFPGDPWLDFPYELRMPLSDAVTFQAALASLGCDGGGLEPSYDVLYALLDQADPAGIGWRGDDPLTPEFDPAFPYVVFMGDEEAQTILGSAVTEALVASRAASCGLPGCVPGDRAETFGIIHEWYSSDYDEITYFEAERLIEIDPPDPDRYVQILRGIFANVCLTAP
ncbi:MAG: hypothetical protein RL272_592 [Candidatus Parcubacteria bacterium]